MPKRGKLVVFTAPSGAGKTSIARAVLNHRDDIQFSVSATTRPQRIDEIPDKSYYFLTPSEFDAAITNNEFVEWEEFYAGNRYGTLKKEVDRIRSQGKHVLFDVEVNGAHSIKRLFGDECLVLFVLPPSVQVLRDRLIERNTESEETLALRLERAEMELSKADNYDCVVKNDILDDAIKETIRILSGYLG
jgi:guanylate kinase